MLFALALLVAVVAAVRGMWSPCGLSMLSSLNPVSESARGNRFWLTAAWYVVGAGAGGAVLGAVGAAGAFGFGALDVSSVTTWTLVLAFAAIAVVSDTGIAGRSLPLHSRQVDERWLTSYRRWIYASGYGVQIGSGFATYIMTSAVYLLAGLAVLTGSPARAFALCVVFGVVRGACIAIAAFARSPQSLRRLLFRLHRADGASRVGVELVEVGVGGAAVGALGGLVPAAAFAAVAMTVVLITRVRATIARPV